MLVDCARKRSRATFACLWNGSTSTRLERQCGSIVCDVVCMLYRVSAVWQGCLETISAAHKSFMFAEDEIVKLTAAPVVVSSKNTEESSATLQASTETSFVSAAVNIIASTSSPFVDQNQTQEAFSATSSLQSETITDRSPDQGSGSSTPSSAFSPTAAPAEISTLFAGMLEESLSTTDGASTQNTSLDSNITDSKTK